MHALALTLLLAAQAPVPPPAAPTTPPATTDQQAPGAIQQGGAGTTPLPPPGKPRLLVIDLVDKGAGKDITDAVNQAVQAQAVESFFGETVTQTQIKVALDAAATQQLLGCESESCMADVAKVVDAAQTLGGSVAKVGDDLVITILSVKVQDGTRLAQQQRKVPINRDLYFYAAKQLTSLVLTGRTVDPRVPVVVNVEQGDAVIIVDGKEIGAGASATAQLDPGSHEIRVRRDGYAEWTTVVQVEQAAPMSISARLVPTRIELWPAAIATGAITVLFGATSVTTWAIAQNMYDGFGGESPTSYRQQTPVSSEQLDSKAQIITILSGGRNVEGEIGTPGIAIITGGLAVVAGLATVALLTTDLVLAATTSAE